jgi:hypothetical protein
VRDLAGLEHDWLAVDADGRVALFSSAGGGVIPDAVACTIDAHDAAIAAILARPASTRALLAPAVLGENTWRLVAERGLYAYDADPNGGPYRRVAVPEVPARLDEVIAIAHRLDAVRFATLLRFAP